MTQENGATLASRWNKDDNDKGRQKAGVDGVERSISIYPIGKWSRTRTQRWGRAKAPSVMLLSSRCPRSRERLPRGALVKDHSWNIAALLYVRAYIWGHDSPSLRLRVLVAVAVEKSLSPLCCKTKHPLSVTDPAGVVGSDRGRFGVDIYSASPRTVRVPTCYETCTGGHRDKEKESNGKWQKEERERKRRMVGRSIAGALSHTLSFSTSIGPERGHEKRLINRTNTANILTAAYTGWRTSSSTRLSLSLSLPLLLSPSGTPHPAHLHSHGCREKRHEAAHRKTLSLFQYTVGPRGPSSADASSDENRNAFLIRLLGHRKGYLSFSLSLSLSLSLSPLTELTINAVQYHTDCGVKKGFEESADVERAAFDLRGVITFGVRVCVKGCVKKLRLIGYCDCTGIDIDIEGMASS